VLTRKELNVVALLIRWWKMVFGQWAALQNDAGISNLLGMSTIRNINFLFF
jgi:hypothetical protein